MSPFRFSLLVFILFTTPLATGVPWQAEGRYTNSATQHDSLEASAAIAPSLYSWLTTETAIRAGITPRDLDKLEYKGELSLAPLFWLRFNLRLSHLYDFGATSAHTHLLTYTELRTPHIFESYFFIRAGWYRRFTHLNKVTIFPDFRSSYSEHDFALGLGFYIVPTASWAISIEANTFEEITVHNLNHPFGQVVVSYQSEQEGIRYSLMGRYQLSLGFGRLEKIIIGVRIEGI